MDGLAGGEHPVEQPAGQPMTGEQFADLVKARCAGPGKWQAKCPAHGDRSPSLSIGEGRDGRVLVRCWAGCPLDSVLKALSLTRAALFAGPQPTPEQLARLASDRAAVTARRKAARAAERQAEDRVLKLEDVVNALGARLARIPDSDSEASELCRLFHVACERHREANAHLAQKQRPAPTGLRGSVLIIEYPKSTSNQPFERSAFLGSEIDSSRDQQPGRF